MTTIVKVSSLGFDQHHYCSDDGSVVFQLMDDLSQATIQYWRYQDENGKDVKDQFPELSLAQNENENENKTKTVDLCPGRYIIKLLTLDGKNTGISGGTTSSGTIDVSGTGTP